MKYKLYHQLQLSHCPSHTVSSLLSICVVRLSQHKIGTQAGFWEHMMCEGFFKWFVTGHAIPLVLPLAFSSLNHF